MRLRQRHLRPLNLELTEDDGAWGAKLFSWHHGGTWFRFHHFGWRLFFLQVRRLNLHVWRRQ